MLTPDEQAEIAELARRYGTPRRWTREYATTTERNREWARRITRRRGEVILVLPRPGGRVLLHTKPTYPEGIYRFPGGGVDRGEAVETAARREAREETGFDVEPVRFVGVVENTFEVAGDRRSYPSFVFIMQPTTQAPHVLDPDEEIAGFHEIPVEELSRIVEQLDALPADWQPWGHFRATPHALVIEAMSNED
jgi:8-oxo-dGTP pyrophosphatase MutT (NUDIX family)